MERMIEQTADGSATLYVPWLDEHYHSVKGALTESRHIFLRMGFEASAETAPSPRILEVGFGTGLNASLTAEAAEEAGRRVHYTGVERYPLPWETVEQLGYSGRYLKALHEAPWETDVEIAPCFTLHKVEADINALWTDGGGRVWDVVYFDAFAPEKQPEMWTQALFDRLYARLSPGGILVTYCAKGAVRRMLQASGFTVERLPGPPGGKREILRGRKW